MQQLLSANNENIDADRITNAAIKHLLNQEDAERITRFLQWNPPPGPPPGADKDPARTAEFMKQMQMRFARGKAITFLRDPLNFYEEIFHATHIPANSDATEVFESELNRETQLKLIKMDPVDAAKDLDQPNHRGYAHQRPGDCRPEQRSEGTQRQISGVGNAKTRWTAWFQPLVQSAGRAPRTRRAQSREKIVKGRAMREFAMDGETVTALGVTHRASETVSARDAVLEPRVVQRNEETAKTSGNRILGGNSSDWWRRLRSSGADDSLPDRSNR